MDTNLVRQTEAELKGAARVLTRSFGMIRENQSPTVNAEFRGARPFMLVAMDAIEAAIEALPLAECAQIERERYEEIKRRAAAERREP